MELIRIASTNINAIGYDADNALMQIQFKNGDVYSYQNVSPDTYSQLLNGDSGRVFASIIKPARYTMPFTKLGNMPLF